VSNIKFSVFTRWDHRFTAEGLTAHYYLPSEPNIQISYIQFCILWEGEWNCECNSLENKKTRDRWHTIVLDFSTCHKDAEAPWDQPWNELELTGLAMQSNFSALSATEPVTYNVYLDAIQIFDQEAP